MRLHDRLSHIKKKKGSIPTIIWVCEQSFRKKREHHLIGQANFCYSFSVSLSVIDGIDDPSCKVFSLAFVVFLGRNY